MSKKNQNRNQSDRWWSFKLTPYDLASAGYELRENSAEAEARHVAYVQNAYATLSVTRQLVWYGARAGLLVGAAVLAVETAVLFAIIVAAMTIDQSGPGFATLYGQTPLVGTFLEPLWPIVLSLPVLPAFAGIGALAALARRLGNQWRRALHAYFNPTSPRLDFATFWVLITVLLVWGAYALGIATAETAPSGLLTLAISAAGLISWPSHHLWLSWYLPLIRAHGSASMEEIRARIQQQL